MAKHKVSFEEASTVFFDYLAEIGEDIYHSTYEEREFIIGNSGQNRLLFVIFIEPEPDLIRIISAREANRSEKIKFENGKL